MNLGESYENKTATIIEKIVGGKCTPASKEENLIDHIDLHWIYEGNDFPVDVKGPKKYNRWDDNASDVEETGVKLEGVVQFRVVVEDGEKVFAIEPEGEIKQLIKDDSSIEV